MSSHPVVLSGSNTTQNILLPPFNIHQPWNTSWNNNKIWKIYHTWSQKVGKGIRHDEVFIQRHFGKDMHGQSERKRGGGDGEGRRFDRVALVWFHCMRWHKNKKKAPHCDLKQRKKTGGRGFLGQWRPFDRLEVSQRREKRSRAVQHFGSSKALVLGVWRRRKRRGGLRRCQEHEEDEEDNPPPPSKQEAEIRRRRSGTSEVES